MVRGEAGCCGDRGDLVYSTAPPIIAPHQATSVELLNSTFHGLGRTCLDRRIGSIGEFTEEVEAYLNHKNAGSKPIHWQFTNEKARIKLKSL